MSSSGDEGSVMGGRRRALAPALLFWGGLLALGGLLPSPGQALMHGRRHQLHGYRSLYDYYVARESVPAPPPKCLVGPPCFCRRTGRDPTTQRISCHRGDRFPRFKHNEDPLGCLSLIYAGLKGVPARAFQNINTREIDLQGNNLGDNVDPRAFIGVARTLQALNMAWANITSLPAKVFRGMLAARNLTLAENKLRIIPGDLLQDLRSLQRLSLAGNPLRHIPADGFRYLTNLEHLDLGYCGLAKLSKRLFSGLWNLEFLDLRGNNIPALASYTFMDLYSLHTLLLSHNPIRSLHHKAFYGLVNMEVLRIHESNLSHIDSGVFHDTGSLKTLDVGDNRLSWIFRGTLYIPTLQHLGLDGNYIRELPPDIQHLRRLKTLDLSYNQLTTLHKCDFEKLSRLEVVNLRENPFVCDCKLFWLRKLQRNLHRKWEEHRIGIPFVPGRCHTPENLRGIAITSWLDVSCFAKYHSGLGKCEHTGR